MADSDADAPLLIHRADGGNGTCVSGSTNGRAHNGLAASSAHQLQRESRRGANSARTCRPRSMCTLTAVVLAASCCAVLAALQLMGSEYFCEQRYSPSAVAAAAVLPRAPLRSGHSLFSDHDCVAGHSTPGIEGIRDATAHSRMCWFRDVCINRERQLFFYSDPALPAEPIRVDTAIHTGFPAHLVNLRRYLPGGGQAFYSVKLLRSAIPSTAVWSPSSIHAIYHQFWPENFGHVLGDDVYPVYQQLRRFGLSASRDVQVLGWLPCSYSGSDNTSRQRACNNTVSLFETVSDRPWMHIDHFFASLHSNATVDDAALVCFEQVVMGHGLNGMYWQGRDWPLFVEHVNQRFAVETQLTRPQQLSILITRKTNRRKVVNFDELVAYLQHVFDMEVAVWEPHQLSFEEQVQRVRQHSVLISPCGGISFVSPFMFPGSSVVYIDWFDPSWNTTSPMEEYVWQHDPRFNRFHYQIKREDIRGIDQEAMQRDSESPAEIDEKRQWRNYALLHIEPQRMAYFVVHALRRAASRLGLPDTLNYTRVLELTHGFDQVQLDRNTDPSATRTQAAHAAAAAGKTWEDDAEAAARKEDSAVDTAGEMALERVAQLTVTTNKASHSAPHCGIPVYHWSPGKGRQNFGDVLGVVLVRLITRFDPRVRFTNLQSVSPKLTSIGSIADTTSGQDWVWSSGVHPWAHAALSEHQSRSRNFTTRFRSIHVSSTRGPRSRQFFLDATNRSLNVPEVFGDGALLLPLYFNQLREREIAAAGQSQQVNLTSLVLIIPHLRDYEAVRHKLAVESRRWEWLNYQLVSVLDPWESVLRQIVRSSLVVSSSLHGIIVAESFGVGARLFRLKSSDGAFKYRDYYEGSGRYGVNLTHSLDDALHLGAETAIKDEQLRSIQRGLLNSFPKQLWDDCPTPPVLFNMPLPPT